MNLADVAAAGDLPLPRDGTPRIGIAPLRHRNGRTVTVRYHVRALRSTAPALAVWVGMPRREQRATAPPDPRRSRDRDRLSPRELEILQLMADGLENEEIARELYISPETVKSHVRRILQKLGAHSRTYAVAVALRRSLVD